MTGSLVGGTSYIARAFTKYDCQFPRTCQRLCLLFFNYLQIRNPLPMQDINLVVSCMRLLHTHLDEFKAGGVALKELSEAQVGCKAGVCERVSVPVCRCVHMPAAVVCKWHAPVASVQAMVWKVSPCAGDIGPVVVITPHWFTI